MRYWFALFLSLATVATTFSAPPEVPAEITAKAGGVREIIVKAPKGKKIGYRMTGGTSADLFRELTAGQDVEDHVFWLSLDDTGRRSIVWWLEGEVASSETIINKGGVPPTPIDPVNPDVKPKPPGPTDPLKSFRVFLIRETTDVLTPQQNSIFTGASVENWCLANCTGGKAGFRRRDKSVSGDLDPTMNDFWKVVQPQITKTPCVAMERNGKIEIFDLEATPAAQVEALSKYRGK